MTESPPKLSARSVAVLEMIAAGSTYEHILAAHPDLTYLDIFRAAEEALGLGAPGARHSAYRVVEKRERYPRTNKEWTDPEDAELRQLVRYGATVARIAGRLQRNRGVIRTRIMKLNLVAELTPLEQERLRRVVERDGEPRDD